MIDLFNNKNEIGVVIFSGSSEPQHLNDIITIIIALSRYGIPKANFIVFIPDPSKFKGIQEVSFFSSIDYETSLNTFKFTTVLSFITGHGSSHGIIINGNQVLSPYSYIAGIENIQKIKNVILITGLCYAGIFNYWDTINKPYKFCLIGATGLHSSLNHNVEENILNNIFLYFISQWFTLPSKDKDVDGDNYSTLMDCFKFAGVMTSQYVLKFRSHWLNVLKKNEAILLDQNSTDMNKDTAKKANEVIMELVYTVQEPWILNANLAREIIF